MPSGFDDAVAWFERISDGLVLLEEFPLDEVREAVGGFGRRVRAHSEAAGSPGTRTDRDGRIAADHRRFLTSVEQLDWLLRIVEQEDHGGHRQALGQYGRLLTESLRRHRREERAGSAPPRGAG
jgi:hypothetical protein